MKRLLAAAILTVAVVGTVAGCGGKDIGRDAALEAALNDAGVSESDTTRLQVSEDRDDGQKVYEIRFDVDNTGYEYEVAAADGSILSSDIEIRMTALRRRGMSRTGHRTTIRELPRIMERTHRTILPREQGLQTAQM